MSTTVFENANKSAKEVLGLNQPKAVKPKTKNSKKSPNPKMGKEKKQIVKKEAPKMESLGKFDGPFILVFTPGEVEVSKWVKGSKVTSTKKVLKTSESYTDEEGNEISKEIGLHPDQREVYMGLVSQAIFEGCFDENEPFAIEIKKFELFEKIVRGSARQFIKIITADVSEESWLQNETFFQMTRENLKVSWFDDEGNYTVANVKPLSAFADKEEFIKNFKSSGCPHGMPHALKKKVARKFNGYDRRNRYERADAEAVKKAAAAFK